MCKAVMDIKEEGREEGNLAIKKKMRNLELTAQQAMDALEIPTANQQRYLKML